MVGIIDALGSPDQRKVGAMSAARDRVSVIIPTTCEAIRSTVIGRAIRSVIDQQGVAVELVVVVNGGRYSRALLDTLLNDKSLRVIQLTEGNVSFARFQGVQHVAGEFFCFLDDDDELLAGSLRSRVDAMRVHPDADVVVSNGFVHDGGDRPLVDEELAARIGENQVESILSTNWFASPSAMFRSIGVDPEIFDIRHKHFEWTYLFFKLVLAGKRIEYWPVVTYRKFEDDSASVSKSEAYLLAYPAFVGELLRLPLAAPTLSALRRKRTNAFSAISNYFLERGELRRATEYYLRTLRHGGWIYIPNIRKIILAALRR